MRELQDCAEHLQCENDRLRAQVGKRGDLDGTDVQDSYQVRHLTARDKGKEHIAPNNVDTPVDNELSSGSSPNLSPTKSSIARVCQRHSHRPTFSNADNGTFCWARREIG